MLRTASLRLSAALLLFAGGSFACGGNGATASGSATTAQGSGGGAAASSGSAAMSSAGTGGGTSATTTTGSSSGGGAGFSGFTRVNSAGKAIDRSADAIIGPDGSIYVSWVDGASNDVMVARSTNGGAKFGAAVTVDDKTIKPLVSMARHPRLAADDKRVAIAFGDQAGSLYLYVSKSDAQGFGKPIAIGTEVKTDFRDFPKPIFLGDGSLAVAWHGFPLSGARLYFARETANYVSEVASGGAPGVPCECCPLEIAHAGGDLVLGFRNNDTNKRDMWVATSPKAAAFMTFMPGSTSEGIVPMCPMQGPRILDTGAGKLAMVWSARGNKSTGAVMISNGTPGGAWTGGAAVAGFMGDEPTLALGAGKIYLAAVSGNMQSAMVSSGDGGKSWSAPKSIMTPEGDLSTPQATSLGGIAALAGVTGGGNVWLLRME